MRNSRPSLPTCSRRSSNPARRPEILRRRTNLYWLAANLRFTLLLDEVGRRIEPAYTLKNRWLTGQVAPDQLAAEKKAALAELKAAPIAELFETYASRVRSRGEQGVLSALNQKLWLQYKELMRVSGRPIETLPISRRGPCGVAVPRRPRAVRRPACPRRL